jgi:hypothetical protein
MSIGVRYKSIWILLIIENAWPAKRDGCHKKQQLIELSTLVRNFLSILRRTISVLFDLATKCIQDSDQNIHFISFVDLEKDTVLIVFNTLLNRMRRIRNSKIYGQLQAIISNLISLFMRSIPILMVKCLNKSIETSFCNQL